MGFRCKVSYSRAKLLIKNEKERNGTRHSAPFSLILSPKGGLRPLWERKKKKKTHRKKKNQLTMARLSKKVRIFAPSLPLEWRHEEEPPGFDPSENLENSRMRAMRLEAVPPVEYSLVAAPCSGRGLRIYPHRCELIFILTHTGIPEPSD